MHSLLEPLEGVPSWGHLDFDPVICFLFYGFQNGGRINFSCFKPPDLWSFVPAAKGN